MMLNNCTSKNYKNSEQLDKVFLNGQWPCMRQRMSVGSPNQLGELTCGLDGRKRSAFVMR
jgi:hypothetical protein